MASNRELSERARELGLELGEEVHTSGLNHEALTKLVSDLQDRADAKLVGDAADSAMHGGSELPDTLPARPGALRKATAPVVVEPEHSAAAEPVVEPVKAVEPEPAKDPVYTVAAGKAITSNRGILDAGTVVAVKDFLHGQETIDDLASKGTLVKS